MKKQKANSGVPRHKRLKRSMRLQAARCWIAKYDGQDLVKGYSKHFAVNELILLGYKIDDKYIEQLKHSLEIQKRINQKKKELKEENLMINTYEDDEDMFLKELEIKDKDNIIALALFGSYNTEQWIK